LRTFSFLNRDVSGRSAGLGVIAESRDWRLRGFDGPHHLEEAATAAQTRNKPRRSWGGGAEES
jgi:hypothetical protein